MRILVAEDEKKTAGFIRKALEEQGFSVTLAPDGDQAFDLATSESFDVIVLDIMLPGRDGLSILRALRDRHNTVPVLLLTARSELGERVEGLNLGADDYVTKPFFMEELVARVQALMRRASGEKLSIIRSGDLVVNLITREVKVGERTVELTTREFNLLEYLMRSPGRVYARTQILDHVWGYDFDPNTNLVDVYIQRLRKKLSPEGDQQFIETIRGVGYRFRRS
ncbi:MAG: response regulator transcription factor [Armatimonadetes bacterium]|nr:response regulator transcription factor [Armatimonadota bacterium]